MSASLDLALDAGAPFGTDECGVSRPCGKKHPIARRQRQRASVAEDELDRPARAVEKLVIRVGVLLVSVSWSVRPSVDVAGIAAQMLLDRARVGRGAAVTVYLYIHTSTIVRALLG